ncbi:MAG: sigma-70 family RNA polymerase sigma factor [Phycisphaerae bacterium]
MEAPSGRQCEVADRSAEELAAEAAAGSSACFEALVRRLGPRLLRYLRQRVGDLHAAEDLLQETFLKAYRNLGRYDPSRSFATWLFTIGTRLAASYWRAHRPAVGIENVDPPDRRDRGPLEAAALREQHANLWALASRTLPGSQFTAMWLRFAEEMAIRDVAAVMEKSVGGVKVLLHRACRRLMEHGAAAVRLAEGPLGDGRTGEALAET